MSAVDHPPKYCGQLEYVGRKIDLVFKPYVSIVCLRRHPEARPRNLPLESQILALGFFQRRAQAQVADNPTFTDNKDIVWLDISVYRVLVQELQGTH